MDRVLGVGKAPNVKKTGGVHHGIEQTGSLIGEDEGSGSRLIREQLSLTDELGPAGECGETLKGEAVRTQFRLMGQSCNEPGEQPTLLLQINQVHPLRLIIGGSPGWPGVIDRHQAESQNSRQTAHLTTECRTIGEVTLPRTQWARTQGVLIKLR